MCVMLSMVINVTVIWLTTRGTRPIQVHTGKEMSSEHGSKQHSHLYCSVEHDHQSHLGLSLADPRTVPSVVTVNQPLCFVGMFPQRRQRLKGRNNVR